MARYPQKKPLVKFRLYPNRKRSHYFIVYIWKNKTALQEHGRRKGKYAAYCTPQEWRRDKKLLPQIGEINFNRKYITHEIIAHEMTHATLAWAKRTKLNMTFTQEPEFFRYKNKYKQKSKGISSPEECFCYALGDLVSEFCRKYIKYCLDKDEQ